MKNKKYYILLITSVIVLFSIITLVFLSPKLTLYAIKENIENTFNLKVDVPANYENVHPGENLLFTAKVLNLANKNRLDVTLKFNILDSNNKVITMKSETVALETQASFVRELKIPENTDPGKYKISTELIYLDEIQATAENSFNIVNESKKNNENIMIITSFLIGIIIVLIFLIIKSKVIIEKIKIRFKIHNLVKNRLKK